MKQKILVKAIIRRGEEVLLLRRAAGNPKYVGQYELPGGKVDAGENPELALRRELSEEIGASVASLQINKTASLLDEDTSSALSSSDTGRSSGVSAKLVEDKTQYVVLAYAVVLDDATDLRLSEEHDEMKWVRLSQIQHINLNDLSKIVFQAGANDNDEDKKTRANVVTPTTQRADRKAVLFADGGSRGNPGPSALGYVIRAADGGLLAEEGKYLGITTNNQAEYHAVKAGLGRALDLQLHAIEVKLDSQLVVNQLSGGYQVKNRDLWPIHASILELAKSFRRISFTHVPRDLNKEADAIVNEVLDSHKT